MNEIEKVQKMQEMSKAAGKELADGMNKIINDFCTQVNETGTKLLLDMKKDTEKKIDQLIKDIFKHAKKELK